MARKKSSLLPKLVTLAVIFMVSPFVILFVIDACKQESLPTVGNLLIQNIQSVTDKIFMTGDIELLKMIYSEKESSDYSENTGKFLTQYFGVEKDCGNNNSEGCFADKYYVGDGSGKEYEPKYEGSCAILTGGANICMRPQIGNDPIRGIIDVNGKRKPNVYGKDLRIFQFRAREISDGF